MSIIFTWKYICIYLSNIVKRLQKMKMNVERCYSSLSFPMWLPSERLAGLTAPTQTIPSGIIHLRMIPKSLLLPPPYLPTATHDLKTLTRRHRKASAAYLIRLIPSPSQRRTRLGARPRHKPTWPPGARLPRTDARGARGTARTVKVLKQNQCSINN